MSNKMQSFVKTIKFKDFFIIIFEKQLPYFIHYIMGFPKTAVIYKKLVQQIHGKNKKPKIDLNTNKPSTSRKTEESDEIEETEIIPNRSIKPIFSAISHFIEKTFIFILGNIKSKNKNNLNKMRNSKLSKSMDSVINPRMENRD